MTKNPLDQLSSEFEINDAPVNARNLLTRGHIHDEITQISGCAVTTRGRYMTQSDRLKNPNERALYLYIQGPNKQSIDTANQKIAEIIRNEQQMLGGGPRYRNVEKIYVGIENCSPGFDLRGKIIGNRGANVSYIRSETGALVTLRGKGSLFHDPNLGGAESSEPLHLYIEHPNRDGLNAAKQLGLNLIETLQQEVAQSQPQVVIQDLNRMYSGFKPNAPPPQLNIPPPGVHIPTQQGPLQQQIVLNTTETNPNMIITSSGQLVQSQQPYQSQFTPRQNDSDNISYQMHSNLQQSQIVSLNNVVSSNQVPQMQIVQQPANQTAVPQMQIVQTGGQPLHILSPQQHFNIQPQTGTTHQVAFQIPIQTQAGTQFLQQQNIQQTSVLLAQQNIQPQANIQTITNMSPTTQFQLQQQPFQHQIPILPNHPQAHHHSQYMTTQGQMGVYTTQGLVLVQSNQNLQISGTNVQSVSNFTPQLVSSNQQPDLNQIQMNLPPPSVQQLTATTVEQKTEQNIMIEQQNVQNVTNAETVQQIQLQRCHQQALNVQETTVAAAPNQQMIATVPPQTIQLQSIEQNQEQQINYNNICNSVAALQQLQQQEQQQQQKNVPPSYLLMQQIQPDVQQQQVINLPAQQNQITYTMQQQPQQQQQDITLQQITLPIQDQQLHVQQELQPTQQIQIHQSLLQQAQQFNNKCDEQHGHGIAKKRKLSDSSLDRNEDSGEQQHLQKKSGVGIIDQSQTKCANSSGYNQKSGIVAAVSQIIQTQNINGPLPGNQQKLPEKDQTLEAQQYQQRNITWRTTESDFPRMSNSTITTEDAWQGGGNVPNVQQQWINSTESSIMEQHRQHPNVASVQPRQINTASSPQQLLRPNFNQKYQYASTSMQYRPQNFIRSQYHPPQPRGRGATGGAGGHDSYGQYQGNNYMGNNPVQRSQQGGNWFPPSQSGWM